MARRSKARPPLKPRHARRASALKGWKTRRALARKRSRAAKKGWESRRALEELQRLMQQVFEEGAASILGDGFGPVFKIETALPARLPFIDYMREVEGPGEPTLKQARSALRALFNLAHREQKKVADAWDGGFLFLVSVRNNALGQPVWEPEPGWHSNGYRDFETAKKGAFFYLKRFYQEGGKREWNEERRHYYRRKLHAIFVRVVLPKRRKGVTLK